MKITNCKCNHLSEPLGFWFRHTTFSWITDCPDVVCSRLVVQSGNITLADTGWDSLDSLGTILSLSLSPRTRYNWRVHVKSASGEEAVSDTHYFETGKMEEPWTGKWITCKNDVERHPIFYKNLFLEKKKIASARLYICGLGAYEAYLNGEKISDALLTPGFHAYNHWVQTQTYDVTELLSQSGSTPKLSVLVGDGWYRSRIRFESPEIAWYGDDYRVIAELHVLYEDTAEQVIGTDESWLVERSFITFSGIYDGEHQDFTLPALPPVPALPAPEANGRLTDSLSVPVRKQETFHPVSLPAPEGEFLLDIRQNLAGTFSLKVNVPYGRKVFLQFGEVLQDGHFYRDNLRTAKAEFEYISDGQPRIIRPHFTFYGFRYIRVTGIENFSPEDMVVSAIYSDIPMESVLTTGNEKLNRLLSNCAWGMKSNFVDLPTDCPQRDERMGWTGDTQVFSETACILSDPYAFYRKYLYDCEQEQLHNEGNVPNIVPMVANNGRGNAVWGDATTIIPWNMYLYSGDSSILEEHYPSMCAWVDYMTKIDGDNHGWRKVSHLGDWLALDCPYEGKGQTRGGTDEGFIGAVYYRKSALITARTARILGYTEDAAHYEALAASILEDIREEFYSPNGRPCVNTQTGALLTLSEKLADPDRALEQLLHLLEVNEDKLKTGFVGTPLLCEQLAAHGQEKLADKILLNEEYPGWLYAVNLGATTIWERWNSLDETGHVSSTGMNSLNHYSYGAIASYIWKSLAGLQLLPEAPGGRRVKIAPHVNWKLRHLNAEYPSAVGTYFIFWELPDTEHIHLTVTIPAGGEAEVVLPLDKENRTVTVSGDTLDITYSASRAFFVHRSIDDTLQTLMCNSECRKILKEEIPTLDVLLAFTRANPLRETMQNLRYEKAMIQRVETRLSEVIE